MRHRSTRDLCQTCWQELHPTEYAPTANRYGTCADCGDAALVTRSATPRYAEPGQRFSAGTVGDTLCRLDDEPVAIHPGLAACPAPADNPYDGGLHEPNDDGTACRWCGLPAEPVPADELAARLIVQLGARDALDLTPERRQR